MLLNESVLLKEDIIGQSFWLNRIKIFKDKGEISTLAKGLIGFSSISFSNLCSLQNIHSLLLTHKPLIFH